MTEHKHEIEIKNRHHLTTRWMVRDGGVTDHRGHHSYFDYALEDAKELRDWLTARIDEIESGRVAQYQEMVLNEVERQCSLSKQQFGTLISRVVRRKDQVGECVDSKEAKP